MSAIAGILRFDGAAIAPGTVEAMTFSMAHRGPDGRNHWAGSRAALGHCMLRTTPESLGEMQPLHEDGLVIVMDGRVDNAPELARELTKRGFPPRGCTDAELVLRSYEAWGDECADRIVGEFAFVIWDCRRARAFAARDVAGARHFYFTSGPGWFAFGSEIKSLLASGHVQAELNQERFLDSLVMQFDYRDQVATCWSRIDRLPAGHSLAVDAGGSCARRYWFPERLEEARFKSLDECAEAFGEQMRAAVESRVRYVGRVGAALSGGLDSSTVVGLLQERHRDSFREPLATFTLVHEERGRCPEWRSVRSMARDGWFSPTVIEPAASAMHWQRRLESIPAFDEPFSLNNGYTDLLVCEAAREQGCRVLIDGMAGDLLFYWFDQSLSFRPRHLKHLPGILRAHLRHRTPGVSRALAMRALTAAAPAAAKRLYRRVRPRPLPDDAKWFRPEVVTELMQRHARDSVIALDDRAAHARSFTRGPLSFAHEGYGQVALGLGIEPRSPFSDRRVIEFALRLPREAKLCNGWYKELLRRSMAGVLPEDVRWRRDVTMHPGGQFRSHFAAALAANAPHVWNRRLVEDRMDQWIDRVQLRKAWDEYERHPEPSLAWSLITLVVSSQWLGARWPATTMGV